MRPHVGVRELWAWARIDAAVAAGRAGACFYRGEVRAPDLRDYAFAELATVASALDSGLDDAAVGRLFRRVVDSWPEGVNE